MRHFSLIIMGLMVSCHVWAEVAVDAWARATPPGATTGAVYGRFSNAAETDMTVTKIGFEMAGHVMVHRTVHEAGMARMSAGMLVVPAGTAVELKPGDLHIMLMGLSGPLKEGCEYPFELTWDDKTVTRHKLLTGGYGQLEAPLAESKTCR